MKIMRIALNFKQTIGQKKIDTLHKIENFDFKKLDCSAYAAQPWFIHWSEIGIYFSQHTKVCLRCRNVCIFKFGGNELVKRRQKSL